MHICGDPTQPLRFSCEVTAQLAGQADRIGAGLVAAAVIGAGEGVGAGVVVGAAVEVAQRRQGQGPALRPPGQELLAEGQVVSVVVPIDERGGHVGEPGAGQCGRHLDVGVAAGTEAAVHLQDEAIVVDDRSVGLLHRHGPGPAGGLPAARCHLEQDLAQIRVPHRVVGEHPGRRPEDRALVTVQEVGGLTRRADPQNQLVVLSRHVDQQLPQLACCSPSDQSVRNDATRIFPAGGASVPANHRWAAR